MMKKYKSTILWIGLILLLIISLIIAYLMVKPKAPLVNTSIIQIEASRHCEVFKTEFETLLSNDGKNEIASNINCPYLGSYEVKVNVKGLLESKEFTYQVIFDDTTAPIIELESDSIELNVPSTPSSYACRNVYVKPYLKRVYDKYSEDVKIYFDRDVKICEAGTNSVIITATDGSLNKSSVKLEITINDDPSRYFDADEVIIKASKLNVRNSASEDSKVIDKVSKDEKYKIIEQDHDQYNRLWLKIEADNKVGWIASWYTIPIDLDMSIYYDVSKLKVGQVIDGYKIVDYNYDLLEEMFIVFEVNKWLKSSSYMFEPNVNINGVGLEKSLFSKEFYFHHGGMINSIVDTRGFSVSYEFWEPNSLLASHSDNDSNLEFYVKSCKVYAPKIFENGIECEIVDFRKPE